MKHTEPPSLKLCANSSLFRIGRNSRGQWVVQDEKGTCGGLFIDRHV
jgi:alpha-tubulin suppressor-like RCC1 family protein